MNARLKKVLLKFLGRSENSTARQRYLNELRSIEDRSRLQRAQAYGRFVIASRIEDSSPVRQTGLFPDSSLYPEDILQQRKQ